MNGEIGAGPGIGGERAAGRQREDGARALTTFPAV
jgi:hypothetical protein